MFASHRAQAPRSTRSPKESAKISLHRGGQQSLTAHASSATEETASLLLFNGWGALKRQPLPARQASSRSDRLSPTSCRRTGGGGGRNEARNCIPLLERVCPNPLTDGGVGWEIRMWDAPTPGPVTGVRREGWGGERDSTEQVNTAGG